MTPKHADVALVSPVLPHVLTGLSRDQLLCAYRSIVRARAIDARILLLLKQGKVFFHIGGSGHEVAQTAMALALKPGSDWAYPYYRDLAFVLQYGYSPEEIMLEALHREGGPGSNGFNMPFHFGHKDLRIVAQSSPTGTQFLQAVGTAMGAAKRGTGEVVYVSSGEGATSEGEFSEALNWAARERFPVIFLVQNNGFAISVPVKEQIAGCSVAEVAKGYQGLKSERVDGCDFAAMYEAASAAAARARRGEGPTLIEADVIRLLPHSSSDDQRKYRDPDELEEERRRDPIPRMERLLVDAGLASDDELLAIRGEAAQEVARAAEIAERHPPTRPTLLLDHVYDRQTVLPSPLRPAPPEGQRIVMVDAINHALAEELEHNPAMVVYGEDVAGKKGGVFTATRGLTERFGEDRVFNSPLAEASIVGTALGLAVRGDVKPVVEIQFGDYIWPAFMQIRNEIAMLRFRSAGTWTCPVVIRVAVGGYIHGGIYHSQSIEAFFTHMPGLRVAFPSNAADAKGLLKAACRMNDPVLFCEHKGLYRQGFAATPEPDKEYVLPFGVAEVRKRGEDITIITWGMLVQRSLDAARTVEESEERSVEVIDLRTLAPWDRETVLNSVRRTGKALIVHEDCLTGGFGGEIAAVIASEAFERLDAPVVRVAAKDCPVPYGPALEHAMLPQEEDIVEALRKLAHY